MRALTWFFAIFFAVASLLIVTAGMFGAELSQNVSVLFSLNVICTIILSVTGFFLLTRRLQDQAYVLYMTACVLLVLIWVGTSLL